MAKIKIFLGDLVHSYQKTSTWTFPLNVGYIAAYTNKIFGNQVEVEIFKRPELLIEAIQTENPALVALSFCTWNDRLNRRVMQIAKQNDKSCFTVGGGYNITSLNMTEPRLRTFFELHADCDAYVFNQGELGFAALVEKFLVSDCDIRKFKQSATAGCITNCLREDDTILTGEKLETIKDLDEIPSPYLTGLFDKFFAEPMIPLLETNRSCPYRCSFCAWGIGTEKLTKFSLQRVLDEVEYFSKRTTKSNSMHICDANFSILPRDIEIAKKIAACSREYGFPGYVHCHWNKAKPDQVFAVGKELKGLSNIGSSYQSINKETLKAIGRTNLPLEKMAELSKSVNGTSSSLYTELILGLPEETRETHIEANKVLMDMGAEVMNYNFFLIPGTASETDENRRKYVRKSRFRLIDNAWGIYAGEKVFESQEIVLETPTMSEKDIKDFRFIHFLTQFMWGKKWYFDFLQLQRSFDIHPFDFIIGLYEQFRNTRQKKINEVVERFDADHSLEDFATHDAMADYWSDEENFKKLTSGSFGKLNFFYTVYILTECHDEFNEFLLDYCQTLSKGFDSEKADQYIRQCRDLIKFTRLVMVQLNENFSLEDKLAEQFEFDILRWKNARYSGPLPRGENAVYDFYLPENRRAWLKTQYNLYLHKNFDHKYPFRKMAEFGSPNHFMYNVRTSKTASC